MWTIQHIAIRIRVDVARERSESQHLQRVLAIVGERETVHAGGKDVEWRNP
jgi:hypothetical protein